MGEQGEDQGRCGKEGQMEGWHLLAGPKGFWEAEMDQELGWSFQLSRFLISSMKAFISTPSLAGSRGLRPCDTAVLQALAASGTTAPVRTEQKTGPHDPSCEQLILCPVLSASKCRV